MRLATLITNTDESAFAKARADDGVKFAEMIASVRPDWRVDPFWATRGEAPGDSNLYDGVMITGSPASVNGEASWIAETRRLVDALIRDGVPIFGACFGHQLIATALGAQITRNPRGWGHGLLQIERVGDAPWLDPELGRVKLYGSHLEQADRLPAGADLLFRGEGCPIAGFRVGSQIYTVQHHPEMDHQFITDLVEQYADEVGVEVTQAARSSLAARADSLAFAETIARFFEIANDARRSANTGP